MGDTSTEAAGNTNPLYRYLCYGHAAFYIITGVWPLLSINTFMKVTGPKTDKWLVKTAGVLITAIGATIGMAGRRGNASPEIPTLAVGAALGLTSIDAVYVAKRRISPIYLLDAAAELGLVALWAIVWPLARKR